MDYEQQYKNEASMFIDIVQRYNNLQENSIAEAYRLMKDSLQAYNRWSKIRHDIRQASSKGQNAEIKERIKDMCDFLKEIHIDCRIVYSNGRDDLRSNREG